jgi:hypothetical protein
MDNLKLETDESVIYQSQKIISSGTGYEAILTDRRFILAESGTGVIREDLPYAAIERAVSEFNTLREPVIILTITAKDGSKRELGLIFVHQPGGMNAQDRDRCLMTLRDRHVPVEGLLHQVIPPSAVRRGAAADAAGNGREMVRPAVPEWTIFGTSRYTREQEPEEVKAPRSPLVLIIAAILIAGFCIGSVLIIGHMIVSETANVTNSVQGEGAGGPVATESVSPTLVLTPETTAVPSTEVPVTPGAVPTDGIWIRVSYPGNFSGSVGAEGWMSNVNGSGTQVYQLPVHDTTIEGTIEKQDGSGNTLDVGIYNGGALVSGSATSKPWGSIDLDIPIGPAIVIGPETMTETPTIVAPPTPDTSIVMHTVPPTGIWVRIAYPGNFTGTISTNGLGRDVNSSGDQFYQLSMDSGIIDGYIEKGDGSVKNMVVQVYKDGTLVTYGNTSAPLGTVEIHTTV